MPYCPYYFSDFSQVLYIRNERNGAAVTKAQNGPQDGYKELAGNVMPWLDGQGKHQNPSSPEVFKNLWIMDDDRHYQCANQST